MNSAAERELNQAIERDPYHAEWRRDNGLATIKQVRYIFVLLDKRDATAGYQRMLANPDQPHIEYAMYIEANKHEALSLNKSDASRWIDRLLTLPEKGAEQAEAKGETFMERKKRQQEERQAQADELKSALAEVPSGHYAIRVDGELKFYRINKKEKGNWAGYIFIDRQASDDYWAVKDHTAKLEVAEAIKAAGVEQALAAYGHEIGRCGICRRTLTDETSIKRGIGPVCAGKIGLASFSAS